MNELALFAGAGGGILGGQLLGWRTVCAVEIDPYCREVLLRRQEDGYLEAFPIWDDVRTFDGCPWRGVVDIVTAGFPCQPFSTAGDRLAENDDRNMWPETLRILGEIRPTFAMLENVTGILSTPYWGTILGDLAEIGLDAVWDVISASSIGANHRRDRVWLLAYPNSFAGQQWLQDNEKEWKVGRKSKRGVESKNWQSSWWSTEPSMGRVVNGLAHRVDRLRAIGNGQVPDVVKKAFCVLTCDNTRPFALSQNI